MELKAIGKIASPYLVKGDAPRQGKLSKEVMTLTIEPEFKSALLGLKKDQHIVVIYWGDRSDRTVLQSVPPNQTEMRGVFASRSPNRPNPLALNVARVLEIGELYLKVVGLDAFNDSPLLDIKPYVEALDTDLEA